MPHRLTIASLADDLDAGRVSARQLVERCLANIDDEAGEGARVFLRVDRDGALAAADAIDRLRQANIAPSRFAGIPVSIKDLFDINGQVTRAGSRVLSDAPPANADARVVARLRRAGFIPIGRTNMTEFAFSGIGINPHYGTPRNRWRRDEGHVPGGSSSGAAVSITDEMAHGALGTDTGGSCRIPAAFNGIVGYKPTARRIPLDGGVPLSFSLDSYGPIARSVECCAILDAVLADDAVEAIAERPLRNLRLALPTTVMLDDLEDLVGAAFECAVKQLVDQGAIVERIVIPEFTEIGPMNAKGGFAAAESYAWHRSLLARREEGYDPRVALRIKRGENQSAADYIDLLEHRRSLIHRFEARVAPYDALIMPTVAIVPPRISDLEDDALFTKMNLLALRNCTTINVIDGCGISLPIHREGDAPVGLMLAGAAGSDRLIFEIAAVVEKALKR